MIRLQPVAPAASAPSRQLDRLDDAPHRLFFFLGMLGLCAVSLWWLAALLSRHGIPALAGLGAPASDHLVFMAYGFMPFFIFGFANTAGPRWLQMPPVPVSNVRAPALAMSAGLLGALASANETASLFFTLLYLAGYLRLTVRFAALLRASRAPDKVHAWMVLGGLAAGAAGLALHLAGDAFGFDAHAGTRALAIWAFLVPLYCTVCHRMLPFFTASALSGGAFLWRPWWLLGVLTGGAVLHGAFEWAEATRWRWLVDAPMALLAGAVVWRWGLMQSLANRLLAMLHLGFVWLAIGYLLGAVQSLLALAGIAALGLAPLHAVTIGFLGSLMLAMVTRVTLGHSGRTLAADSIAWWTFVAFQPVAVMRAMAEVFPRAYTPLILGAALLWCAALISWGLRNAVIYLEARADGAPG